MEQNLQTVIDFINKNIHLSEEEKASLISNLKQTDKKNKGLIYETYFGFFPLSK